MDKRPMWTGKLLDANGRVGKLEMDAAADGGRGVFQLELQERDGRPVLFRGEVTLQTEGPNVRLYSSAQAEQRGTKLEWEASLTRAEAGRYARGAMLGTYSLAGGGPELPLTKGVVILWQFS